MIIGFLTNASHGVLDTDLAYAVTVYAPEATSKRERILYDKEEKFNVLYETKFDEHEYLSRAFELRERKPPVATIEAALPQILAEHRRERPLQPLHDINYYNRECLSKHLCS